MQLQEIFVEIFVLIMLRTKQPHRNFTMKLELANENLYSSTKDLKASPLQPSKAWQMVNIGCIEKSNLATKGIYK